MLTQKTFPSAPTRADVMVALAESESGELVGVASWIVAGLKIEETQSAFNLCPHFPSGDLMLDFRISVGADARQLRKNSTAEQKTKLLNGRNTLQNRIAAFELLAAKHLPRTSEEEDIALHSLEWEYWDDLDQETGGVETSEPADDNTDDDSEAVPPREASD